MNTDRYNAEDREVLNVEHNPDGTLTTTYANPILYMAFGYSRHGRSNNKGQSQNLLSVQTHAGQNTVSHPQQILFP